MAEVTAIIPTYDRADLLGHAIDSVLAQDADVEVIVVDDCSTDSTPELLAGYGDRIRAIRLECNSGQAVARNRGAREAAGSVLAFLDSDDQWKPGKLAAQLPLARAGRASVTGIEYVDADGTPTGRTYAPSPGAVRRILWRNDYLAAPSTLVVPADAFAAAGGFPAERAAQGAEDWLLLVRLAHEGTPPEVVPEPLTAYRVHPSNWMGDPERAARSIAGALDHVRREGLASGMAYRRAEGRWSGQIARGYAWHGRWPQARAWTARSLRAGHPLEAARTLALVPVSAAVGAARRTRRTA